jgi:hypothetical protein
MLKLEESCIRMESNSMSDNYTISSTRAIEEVERVGKVKL